MAKKRKKLDEFLHARKQSQETVLEERTQLSNRLFRAGVGFVVILLLLALVEPSTAVSIAGLGMLFLMIAGLVAYTLKRLQPDLFPSAASFNQFIFLLLISIFAYKCMLMLEWSEYFAPLPLIAMIVGMAYSQIAGVLVVVSLAFYMALLTSSQAAEITPALDFPLAVVLSIGGVVSVLGVAKVRQQSRPVTVGFYCGAAQALTVLCFQLLGGDFTRENLQRIDTFVGPGLAFAGGLMWGGVLTSFLPVVEIFFGVVSERRLLQLADPSNKLLRVLRERASGTFQHTLGVQQLARNAAEAIGADVLLTEVGAYYHDIGKICKPEYFVENMGEDKGIHDRLRPSMSKMIIISHVKDGILMAREEKLPQKIIDMIPMHHGTTVVEFFFRKARKESSDEENRIEDVSYRYPGPKPAFAEAGILMLADSVEAIAKSMQEPTSNRFQDMIRENNMRRLQDGQLDECNLTIADLRKIEDSFLRTLTTMYHSRIDYNDSDGIGSTAEAKSGNQQDDSKVGEAVRGLKSL